MVSYISNLNMNILLVFPGFIIAFIIVFCYEYKIRNLSTKSKNNVHFYVARDKDGTLWLYMGKPFRDGNMFCTCLDKKTFALTCNLERVDLKYEDYNNLKWEDEPVEIFLNMEN